jgi:hypothetical protein
MIAAGFHPSALYALIVLQKDYCNGSLMKRLGCSSIFSPSISPKKEMPGSQHLQNVVSSHAMS